MNRVLCALLCSTLLALPIGCGADAPIYQGKTLAQWLDQLESDDGAQQQQAIDSLSKIGASAADDLRATLDHTNRNARVGAACALLQTGPNGVRSVEEFARTTQDPFGRVYAASAMYKENVKTDIATRWLLMTLKDPDPTLRHRTIATLAELHPGCEAAVPVLGQTLRNPDTELRWRAAFALLRIGPGAKAAMPDLILALKDPDDRVRDGVAQVLGAIGSEAKAAASPAITEALEDSDPKVRWRAAQLLKQWEVR